jgi:hypothetical protein
MELDGEYQNDTRMGIFLIVHTSQSVFLSDISFATMLWVSEPVDDGNRNCQ